MTDTAKAREYRFTTWDDTTLIITVDEIDPGDMGEPRMLVDYDNGPTTYVSVRATLDAERERYAALAEAAAPILDRCLDFFGADDLDPESSEAMPVVIKNRWVYALHAALEEDR